MNRSDQPHVVILGNSGVVGRYLLQQVVSAGYCGTVVARKEPRSVSGFEWVQSDRFINGAWSVPPGSVILVLWPIWMVGDAMPSLAAAKQVVTLSSTSILNRGKSTDAADRAVAVRLTNGEAAIAQAAETFDLAYTILRPTLVYDGVSDRSIMEIARLIRKLGFFIVAGKGRGLRQPVHGGDVAEAMVRSISNEKALNRSFNLTGGETLTYREMVRRIFEGMGRRPRVVSVPRLPLKAVAYVLNTIGYTRHRPNIADRMELDLAYNCDEAVEALDFRPRPFHPTIRFE